MQAVDYVAGDLRVEAIRVLQIAFDDDTGGILRDHLGQFPDPATDRARP